MNQNKEISPGKVAINESDCNGIGVLFDTPNPGIFVMNKRKLKYRRTIRGMIKTMYDHQKENSKKRGHELPKYSDEELIQWCISQSNFEALFSNWIKSDYNRMLKPSVDRLNDYEGYSFDNIRLVTWGENLKSASESVINGANNKNNRSVYQIDNGDNIINEYHSLTEAERKTGISHHNIWSVCNNIRKTAGSYKWKYKNN